LLGAYDVARVTGGSLPPPERTGHHQEIAGRWHARLVDLGVAGYSWDQAWHDYRLGMLLAPINLAASARLTSSRLVKTIQLRNNVR
jgi:hypothetical protein